MTKLTAKAAGTFAIAPTPFHDDAGLTKNDRPLTDFYAESAATASRAGHSG